MRVVREFLINKLQVIKKVILLKSLNRNQKQKIMLFITLKKVSLILILIMFPVNVL